MYGQNQITRWDIIGVMKCRIESKKKKRKIKNVLLKCSKKFFFYLKKSAYKQDLMASDSYSGCCDFAVGTDEQ